MDLANYCIYLTSRQLMRQLTSQHEECEQILGEVTEALSHLDHLRERYVAVSTKTNALHDACEHLLAEQVSIVGFFNSLDYAIINL